jgi:hypothetical protein
MYVFHVNNYITIVLTTIFILIALAIAFIPLDDRPLDVWITNFVVALKSPTQRIWKKNRTIPKFLELGKQKTASMMGSKKDISTFLYQSPFENNINIAAGYNRDDALDVKEKTLIANIDKINSIISQNNRGMPNMNNVPQNQTVSQTSSGMYFTPGQGGNIQESTAPINPQNPLPIPGLGMPNQQPVASSGIPNQGVGVSDNQQPYTQANNTQTIPTSNDVVQNNHNPSVGSSPFDVDNATVNTAKEDVINTTNPNIQVDNINKPPVAELDKILARIQSLEDENKKLKTELVQNTNVGQEEVAIGNQNQSNFNQQALIDSLPEFTRAPNVISGVIVTGDGKVIPDAIVIIKDNNEKPVRAIKSNQLGQFYTRTQLPSGKYDIEIAASGYTFNHVGMQLEGKIIPPFLFIPTLENRTNLTSGGGI